MVINSGSTTSLGNVGATSNGWRFNLLTLNARYLQGVVSSGNPIAGIASANDPVNGCLDPEDTCTKIHATLSAVPIIGCKTASPNYSIPGSVADDAGFNTLDRFYFEVERLLPGRRVSLNWYFMKASPQGLIKSADDAQYLNPYSHGILTICRKPRNPDGTFGDCPLCSMAGRLPSGTS